MAYPDYADPSIVALRRIEAIRAALLDSTFDLPVEIFRGVVENLSRSFALSIPVGKELRDDPSRAVVDKGRTLLEGSSRAWGGVKSWNPVTRASTGPVIDAGRALALADAVRSFLRWKDLPGASGDGTGPLREALHDFERGERQDEWHRPYQIVFGDTLSGIAERFNVKPSAVLSRVQRLAELNRIKNPDQIAAGWWIVVPVPKEFLRAAFED